MSLCLCCMALEVEDQNLQVSDKAMSHLEVDC